MGDHVMECLGLSRVTIRDGRIVDITEPKVKYCPLFRKLRGIEELDIETVRENIEYRISSFGMCSENRETRMKDVLSFGISETLSTGLRDGELDAVVLAADGCGTAIVRDPEIVQGMGGRISGIRSTSPIGNVIDAIGEQFVLDPETTPIDMAAGARKARDMGFVRIAVTTASVDEAGSIRSVCGEDAVIALVHTTGMSREDAERAFDVCDIITACASEHIREVARERDGILQAGSAVPVYGVTGKGKKLVSRRLEITGKKAWDPSQKEDPPVPLLRSRSIRLQRQMRARPEIDQRDALLSEAPAELLVVGEDIGALLLGELHDSIVPGQIRGDDLVLPGQSQCGACRPVIEVLQLSHERPGDEDPRLSQKIAEGEIEIYPDLERHE